MDDKLFWAITKFSGRLAVIDQLMIFLSKKIRYVYLVVLIYMWFKDQKSRKVTTNAVISILITLIIQLIIKLFYFKPRPFIKRRVGILIPSKMDSTFPSKHTLLVFAVSTSCYFYNRVFGIMMSALSFLTGFSRIWVGSHYPSDIIGSAAIGSVTGLVVEKLSRYQSLFIRSSIKKEQRV